MTGSLAHAELDQRAARITDLYLSRTPVTRVTCEVMVTRPARLPPGVQQCSAPPRPVLRSPSPPPGDGCRDGPVAGRRSAGNDGRADAGRRAGNSRRGASAARPGPDGRERRHARRLHRARLRPVPRPRPALDEPLAQPLAVPGRRHLHLRQLPRLPRPAEPHAAVDRHPARQGLAAAADHPRPAGGLPAAVPAGTTTTRRSTRSAAPTVSTSGPATRAPPRRPRPSASPQALGIAPGSTLWYDLEGFNDNLGDCRESALAFLSTWTDQLHALGLQVRRLLQRRLRHRDARRRPRRAARHVHAPRPDLDRPLGRQRPTPPRRTSARTAGCRAAG